MSWLDKFVSGFSEVGTTILGGLKNLGAGMFEGLFGEENWAQDFTPAANDVLPGSEELGFDWSDSMRDSDAFDILDTGNALSPTDSAIAGATEKLFQTDYTVGEDPFSWLTNNYGTSNDATEGLLSGIMDNVPREMVTGAIGGIGQYLMQKEAQDRAEEIARLKSELQREEATYAEKLLAEREERQRNEKIGAYKDDMQRIRRMI